MEVSAKDLRKQPGKILKRVTNGQEVVVTYRGKKLARFVKLTDLRAEEIISDGKDEIFGLWKSHANTSTVDEQVRNLRERRLF